MLVEKTLALDEVDFVDDGDYIDINVGQHLRDLGFIDGEYEVEYKYIDGLVFAEVKIKRFDKEWYE